MNELKQYLFNRIDALKEQRRMCNSVTQLYNITYLNGRLDEIEMMAEKMQWNDIIERIYQ